MEKYMKEALRLRDLGVDLPHVPLTKDEDNIATLYGTNKPPPKKKINKDLDFGTVAEN